MLINQLVKPIGYLFIKHPFKWVVDWLYPSILCLLFITLVCKLSSIDVFLRTGGTLSLILGFVQSLPGFYIAALAAIATFGRLDIDDILPEPTPKVVVKLRGADNVISLTRRRFLAMLFAFLTAESVILTILAIVLIPFSADIQAISVLFKESGKWIAIGLSSIYMIGFFQMVLATFWGLYYLGYKLQE